MKQYKNVYADYNEFAKDSYNYIIGNDYIAFLIKENEVIYWNKLELVWKILGVKTKVTGNLPDGRTTVDVTLNYIEGQTKYTIVPMIPDPERITGLSNFLNKYIYIEEINLINTINLINLDNAFTGNIKHINLPNTEKVYTADNFLYNINDNTASFEITFNKNNFANNNAHKVTVKELNIDTLTINAIGDENAEDYISPFSFVNVTINKLNVNGFNVDAITVNSEYLNIKEITCDGRVTIKNTGTLETNSFDNINKITAKEVNTKLSAYTADNELIIDADIVNIDFYIKGTKSITLSGKICVERCNQLNYIFTSNDSKQIINIKFGFGIDYPSNIIPKVINDNNCTIGSFLFTTPIVDDTFYNNIDTIISTFQYKTTFKEIADIYITENVDNNLIYFNGSLLNDEYNNYNIEIYNKVNSGISGEIIIHGCKYITKYIIDNNRINLGTDISNYPIINSFFGDNIFTIEYDENYRISGKYRLNNNYNFFNSVAFKDIDIYTEDSDSYIFIHCYCTEQYMFTKNRNIRFNKPVYIYIYDGEGNYSNYNFVVDTLVKNNELKIGCSNTNGDSTKVLIKYIENVKLNIIGGELYYFKNWIDKTTKNNYITISGNCRLQTLTDSIISNFNFIDDVYINCVDDYYIFQFDGFRTHNRGAAFTPLGKNIHGNINISLSGYLPTFDYTTNNIEHIDLNKVFCHDYSQYQILRYLSLDDETTINLITKLVDNTSDDKVTIYIYRSQANIIGEDNIAEAVTKNYEIAIIEN